MTRLLRRLRYLLQRDRHERELDDELQFHLDMKQRELESRGVDRATAAATARRSLGNLPLTRDHVRDVWIAPWLWDEGVLNLRAAVRGLRRAPATTAMIAVMLSLGLGTTTTIFGIVSPLFIRPLPYQPVEEVCSLGPAVQAAWR